MTIDEIKTWAAEIDRLADRWNPWSPILAYDHPSGLRINPTPPREDSWWKIGVCDMPIVIDTKHLPWALGAIDRMAEEIVASGRLVRGLDSLLFGVLIEPLGKPIPPSFDEVFNCMPAKTLEEFEAWYARVR